MDKIRQLMLIRRYDRMFCKIEEHDSKPIDLYHNDAIDRRKHPNVEQVEYTSEGKYRVWRLVTDKSDPLQLQQAIESQIKYWKDTYPYEDIQPFIDGQMAHIRAMEGELFPNHNRGDVKHYNGYKHLQAYKRALRAIANQEIWKGVFHSSDEYEKFRYLHENYTNDKKNRWTYIYYALSQEFRIKHLSAAPFLRWIKKHYDQDLKAGHLQDHIKGTDTELDALVRNYTPDT